MKKIVMACLGLAAVLTSCSDDDTSGSNSPLVSTLQTIYDGGAVEGLFKSEYNNGKITKIKWLSPNNVQTGYDELSYSNNGLLTSINSYYGATLYSSSDYTYDNQGRMTASHYTSIAEETENTITFTHNNDNTITSFSDNGWSPAKTYFINSSGYVYKEVKEGSTYEITYDGAIPVSATYDNLYTTTFEYDSEHDRSLLNINMGEGNFKPNAVLRLNSLTNNNGSTNNKYLRKEINEGNVTIEYIYTFNEDGLPVTLMEYHNDELTNKIEYFYE